MGGPKGLSTMNISQVRNWLADFTMRTHIILNAHISCRIMASLSSKHTDVQIATKYMQLVHTVPKLLRIKRRTF